MTPRRTVPVVRSDLRLEPDARRVLARPHTAASREEFGDGHSAARLLLERLVAIPERDVGRILNALMNRYAGRHRGLEQVLEHHFQIAAVDLPPHARLSRERRLLIGAYFSMEYAVESTALFNPSMVESPDQAGAPAGARRFVMSLRAVGEGHLSTIEFREGIVHGHGGIELEPASPFVSTGHRTAPMFSRLHVQELACEMGADEALCRALLEALPERFHVDDLDQAIHRLEQQVSRAVAFETVRIVRLVTASNYEVAFAGDVPLSERVLPPAGPRETQGLEDARFVRFVDDDGRATYFATYTAYDGFGVLPQLIQTVDFSHFRISTMSGRFVCNKGMALFPRRIGGKFAMLARHDEQNLHLMLSDDVRIWNESRPLLCPKFHWGIVRIGNCGSPIETPEGWLLLTHGVGPLREYSIGAAVLHLEDPSRVLAELPTPLLEAEESEREGYVPNVVYSCGAMLHGDHLVVPYGYADRGTRFATIRLEDLLAAVREVGGAE